MKDKAYYYNTLKDDFFDDGKSHKLPNGYEYIKTDFLSRCKSAIVYGLAVIFGTVYCRVFLRMRIKGAKCLKKQKGGFILYGNHTQPVGDVFIPALCCFPKRIYTVVSPANFDIPVIGKILRPLGAIPLSDTLTGMKAFTKAMQIRVQKHPVVIYPEAHVWPYYTDIRPFSEGAFKYPEKFEVPSFVMTTTYQKSKLGKKPRMTVYINGPFYPNGETQKEKAKNLNNKVFECMKNNSKNSNVQYIKYISP